jgi:MerR family transcriptional regulator/heat shock protein HspR
MRPVEQPGSADLKGSAGFSVGQVADLLGVQQAFLRRVERFDLVRPDRSTGQQRRYRPEDVAQLRTVIGLIDEGLTLTGVARVLELQAEVDALRAEIRSLKSSRAQHRT